MNKEKSLSTINNTNLNKANYLEVPYGGIHKVRIQVGERGINVDS